MKASERISFLVEKLIGEGEELCKNIWDDNQFKHIGLVTQYVDLEGFKKLIGSFNLLLSLLGNLGKPWQDIYEGSKKGNRVESAMSVLGALKSIKESLEDGLLIDFEDIVYAEAFSNLSEQAQYLFEQGYFLASGVLLRAILEERLKRLCERHGSIPGKARCTIADYNQNLYASKIYDKISFKHVEAMAAIGNAAAHNDPNLTKEEVERLLRDVSAFLLRFST